VHPTTAHGGSYVYKMTETAVSVNHG